VVGPRQKILQSRRVRARAELRAAGFGALLYGWLEGRPPRTVAQLLDAGVLGPQDLRHRDGRAIRLEPASGARSQWGNAAWVTPHLDLELTQVSDAERGAYLRFAATYQSYWRRYIDPVGVQLRWTAHGLDVDARMMPLLRRSEYRELMDLVGDTRIEMGDIAHGLRFVFAVAEGSGLRRELDAMGRKLSGHRDVGLGWLGDWVMVGSADRSGLWDVALTIGEVPQRTGTHLTRRAALRKRVLNRAPVYVAAQVRNRLSLAATLAGLKMQLASVGGELATWGPTTAYGGVQIIKIEETLSRREVEEPLSLFYAIVDDVFVLSLDRPTLEGQIDAIRAGAIPRAAKVTDAGPQATLAVRPASAGGYLNRTLLGLLEHAVIRSHRGAMMAYETLAVGLAGPPETAVSPAQAVGFLGRAPISVHGGVYSLDARGRVQHSRYGPYTAPTMLSIPVDDSALTTAIEAMDVVRMSVGFEGGASDRSLVTQIHWAPRRP